MSGLSQSKHLHCGYKLFPSDVYVFVQFGVFPWQKADESEFWSLELFYVIINYYQLSIISYVLVVYCITAHLGYCHSLVTYCLFE